MPSKKKVRTNGNQETRPKYHHGDLQRAAHASTLEILQDGGLASLSLREVARRLGVTHAALYRHYRDRQALLIEVGRAGFDRLSVCIRAAAVLPAESEQSRIRKMLSAYLHFAKEEAACFRLMYGPELSEREAFPDLARSVEESFALLRSAIDGAQRAGELRPAPLDTMAGIAVAFAHGLAMWEINGLGRTSALGGLAKEEWQASSWRSLWIAIGGLETW